MTPQMMTYGLLPMLQIESKLNQPIKRIPKSLLIAKRNLIKRKYNKDIVKGQKTDKKEFHIGQQVCLYRPTANKLTNKWKLAYTIVDKTSCDGYKLRKGRQIITANKTHIKPFFR